jgi:hypothetical protein
MSGAPPLEVTEEDLQRARAGTLPRGASGGYRFKFFRVEVKSAVFLRRGAYSGVDNLRVTDGVFGPSGTQGPVLRKDPHYSEYLNFVRDFT